MKASLSVVFLIALLMLTSAARAQVVISEIHYHPVEVPAFNTEGTPFLDLTDNVHEFVEIQNTGASTVDLSGWTLAGGISYTFPTNAVLAPPGGGGQGAAQRPGGGRRGFGPPLFLAPPLFAAMDANQDGAVTRQELEDTFANWFTKWATNTSGKLTQVELRDGLNAALPRPNFGGPRGGPGFGGPDGVGPRRGGPELDPLANANESSKPLLSKMLAVPSLRARYLAYVHDIADKWLDWSRLGPIATQYHALIADEVKADTRKLDSFEAFQQSLADEAAQAGNSRGPGGGGSIKRFADQRRAYLLKYREVATSPAAKDK